MIKTIFFDLGEVVLTNDWHYDCPEKFSEYSKYFGITYDDMERGWNEAWPKYELGVISENKFWEIFLKTARARNIDIDKAKLLWRKYFSSKPEMFPSLAKLKENYKLVVLSATGKEWLNYKIRKYNLHKYFSDYITTFNTGLKKTDENIYYLAAKKLDVKLQECLLIDDTDKVIQTANSVGMKTILFKSPKQLNSQLYKLHLL